VRFMFLSVHYRKKLDYSDAFAENAKNNYLRLKETLENLEFALASAEDTACSEDGEILKILPELETLFREALEDDFNTLKPLQFLRSFPYSK